jgi:hypothetical protein
MSINELYKKASEIHSVGLRGGSSFSDAELLAAALLIVAESIDDLNEGIEGLTDGDSTLKRIRLV